MGNANDEARHRYVALDSLRGVCACLIVLYHIPGGNWFELLPAAGNGFLFVDFFFVLSGFVIGSSYGDRLAEGFSVVRFAVLRLFRVYPLHLFMLAVFVSFELLLAANPGVAHRAAFAGDYSVEALVQSLLLVQVFFGPDATPWNGPSWSIATEIWAYLLFALTMKVSPRFIVPICLAVVLIAPVLLAMGSVRNLNAFHDGAMWRCLFGFAMGVLCWKLPAAIREVRLPAWTDHVLELAAVTVCLAFVAAAGAEHISLAAPALFLFVVSVFSRERGIVSVYLRMAPMVLIGRLSYSIYLVHLFVVWRLVDALAALGSATGMGLTVDGGLTSNPAISVPLTLAMFAVILGLSWCTYRFVEEPGRRLGRRLAAGDVPGSSGPARQSARNVNALADTGK